MILLVRERVILFVNYKIKGFVFWNRFPIAIDLETVLNSRVV